jgi:dienelactone hydrolase
MRRTTSTAVAVLFLSLIVIIIIASDAIAQTRPAVTPAEYGQFESLAMPPRGGLSPDGKWLAYAVNRSNRENELRILRIADGATTTIAFGAQPAFSGDSKWAAYAIGQSEAEEERLRRQRKPIHRKLGLMNLATGALTVVDGIQSFAFSSPGTHLAMRRYGPERPPNAPAPGPDDPPAGTTLIVRELASGRDTTFGNVSDYAWQDVSNGHAWGRNGTGGGLLALLVSAEDKTGNGVQLFDAASSALRVLDSAPAQYAGVAWRKDSSDLAVLRSTADPKREGLAQIALAWTGLAGGRPASHRLDPGATLPAGMRLVDFRRPFWSHDGRTIYVGVAEWRVNDDGAPERAPGAAADTAEDVSSVEVWHARDVDVMARQKITARADRQRNLLAAWHLDGNSLVTLGKDRFEQVTPLPRQRRALAAQWTGYAMDRTIGRGAADLSLVDTTTGERTRVVDAIDDRYAQPSPGGRYILYFHADHYWTIDTETRAITNLTRTIPASFVNRESDATVRQKPPFGVAGWTKDDAAVVLYDKLDLWKVAPDGSGAARLTNGTADQVRHRYVRLDADEVWIDTDRPVYVSLFGVWTKQSGYGRLAPETGTAERLVWLEKGVGGLTRAAGADVFAYVVQAFDDSPDVFVGDASLRSASQVTATNAFQSKYAWGRSEVVEFRGARGDRLKGSLHYPAGYEPGRKYPTIVYLYERLSDGVHRYVPPSERDYYNASVFTSLGYVFFQPDIVFRPRDPGLSVLECVEPAVRKIVAMGIADPGRVGVVGHSWGGFDAAYLATHSTMFAAAVAGAPIVNLVSNYGNHHWSSGIAETDHIETGQQRMEVPLWEDLPAYIRNSAVFNVHNMKTPLLIEVGDADGTVFWHQGVELYNIARRAKKDVVLLNYAGEDHGLRRKANQIDYQRRIVQWFGHYLKSEPAEAWIARGTSVLEREDEVKRAKAKSKSGS